MQVTRSAALAGVQAFLADDREYTSLLERLEQSVHKRLRFECAPAGDGLAGLWEFLELEKHLHVYHELFQRKLHQLCERCQKTRSKHDDGAFGDLVSILDDMLRVVRVLYAQIFCKSESIEAALNQFGAGSGGGDSGRASILAEFLAAEKLTTASLVNRPLSRFHAMIELAEVLSKVFKEDPGPDDASLAPRLLRIAQDNKHYIHLVQSEAREERELIALQRRFRGEQASAFQNLCGRKLILHGEVSLDVYTHARVDGQPRELKKAYAHCFQDGTLVMSVRAGNNADEDFQIVRVLQLKEDGVFIEFLPDLVAEAGGLSRGRFVVIMEEEHFVFSSDEESFQEQWADAIGGFLASNDSRTKSLSQERASETAELPDALVTSAVDCHLFAQAPSFHDDPIPGLFWARIVGDKAKNGEHTWRLAEIVLSSQQLLVFDLKGWKKHELLTHFDMTKGGLSINEEQSGEKDWNLVVSSEAATICLASKKRTRIDYWYDQVSKTIEGQRGVVEKAGAEEKTRARKKLTPDSKTGKKPIANSSPAGFINARTRRRSGNTVVVDDAPHEPGNDRQQAAEVSSSSAKPARASRSRSKTASNETPASGTKRKRSPVKSESIDEETTEIAVPATTSTSKGTPTRSTKKKKSNASAESTSADTNAIDAPADDKRAKNAATGVAKRGGNRRKAAADSATSETEVSDAVASSSVLSTTTEENDVAADASATPINPKRRWMKRKVGDPNDASVASTPVSKARASKDGGGGADEPAAEANRSTEEGNAANSSAADPTPSSAPPAIRIILTGIELTPTVRKKIRAIPSAVYEDDVEQATHVIAPKDQLKRTVKMLCGISCCAHVVDERWLDESARVGAPIYERAHCLKDTKAESKWHFDLTKTMYDFTPAQRRQLFAGHTVFITTHKSILPPVKDLVKIVECAGGKATTKGSAGPGDLVITTEAALGVGAVQKALASANQQRIYTPELILSSILQQHIAFDQHRVSAPATTGRGGGSRRGK